ncbi:hypothetical protein BDV18DRAFT_158727 [Aspergillus unguis]
MSSQQCQCITRLDVYRESIFMLLIDPAAWTPTRECTYCKQTITVPTPAPGGHLEAKSAEIKGDLQRYEDRVEACLNDPAGFKIDHTSTDTMIIHGYTTQRVPPFTYPTPVINKHPGTLRDTFTGETGDIATGIYYTPDGHIELGVGTVLMTTPTLVFVGPPILPLGDPQSVNHALDENAFTLRNTFPRNYALQLDIRPALPPDNPDCVFALDILGHPLPGYSTIQGPSFYTDQGPGVDFGPADGSGDGEESHAMMLPLRPRVIELIEHEDGTVTEVRPGPFPSEGIPSLGFR